MQGVLQASWIVKVGHLDIGIGSANTDKDRHRNYHYYGSLNVGGSGGGGGGDGTYYDHDSYCEYRKSSSDGYS